ncbi:MAG: hypothetical protein IT236_17970 [Bacteroidia bacterium]|nr:hypothetical protein [Bacteroidia bacterium]
MNSSNYTTPHTIDELDFLFASVPPNKLRENITLIFFTYLNNVATDAMPKNFKETSENIYSLIKFLEQAEKKFFD